MVLLLALRTGRPAGCRGARPGLRGTRAAPDEPADERAAVGICKTDTSTLTLQQPTKQCQQ
jgi:hypothetical protein